MTHTLTIQESAFAADHCRGARAQRGPVKIIVGGAALDEASAVWKTLGADGYAPSVDEAVRLGGRLVGA